MNAVSPSFISSFSDSTFVLILSAHSFILSAHSPCLSTSPLTHTLPVCYHFLLIFFSFRFPSHSFYFSSAWPLCTHFPLVVEKRQKEKEGGKEKMSKEGRRQRGDDAGRVLSVAVSPHAALQIEGAIGVRAPKICLFPPGSSTWQWLCER